jgi:multidrug efflux pump subunit AcrA (membrane-fusion protein)
MIASVAQNDGWRGGGVKEYQTQVSIDDLPKDAGLRPGMTAEVKILIKTVENALTVPVQAVTEFDSDQVAYVAGAGGLERRKLKVGESNEQLIQVLEGLVAGERVALDARSRASLELKQKEKEESKKGGPAADPKTDAEPPGKAPQETVARS